MQEMRAVAANLRISNIALKKLQYANGSKWQISEQMATLNSVIGSNVRWYLKCLLESCEEIPEEQLTNAKELLQQFLCIGMNNELEGSEIKQYSTRKRRHSTTTATEPDVKEGNVDGAPARKSKYAASLAASFAQAGVLVKQGSAQNDTGHTRATTVIRCWLYVCNAALHTTQQLHEHIKEQHADEYWGFVAAAAMADDGQMQHPLDSPELRRDTESGGLETAASPKLQNAAPLPYSRVSRRDLQLTQGLFDEDYLHLVHRHAMITSTDDASLEHTCSLGI